MNDEQQNWIVPPSVEYRSRDVQQFLDNLDLLRKDPKTDDTSEIAAFLSDLENQPEEGSRRARELIEKVAREQEIRTIGKRDVQIITSRAIFRQSEAMEIFNL